MNNVVEMPRPDDGQQEFEGMPIKYRSFQLDGAKGVTDLEFEFNRNVRGTWVGRMAGVTYKNEKRILLIEVLEAEITGGS